MESTLAASPASAPDAALAELPNAADDPLVLGRAYRPGKPFPQGATWDGNGVNFALYSAGSEWVDLCLFDRPEQTHESLWQRRSRGLRGGCPQIRSAVKA